jgi:lipoate-protein ligase A
MKFLELTFDQPAANLACDEALLEMMEAEVSRDGCLRVWEANRYFVVLGHSDGLRSNVNVAACLDQSVPIVRRMSGGGTVVQGPGCLNYSLIIRNDPPGLKSIGDTFEYVLERHRAVVEKICGGPVRLEGISDLTLDGLKFSGNAQYRKSRAVLVHGTFLLHFDLTLMATLLPLPARQPAYRRRRSHLEFLTNLQADSSRLRELLKDVWACEESLVDVPFSRIDQLVRDRYGKAEWSEKF